VRLLLFDIDGTLVNTLGAGKAALDTAMRGVYGETGPIDSFDFHGKTDPAIVRGLLRAMDWPDAKIEAGFDATWGAYLEELDRELAQRGGQLHAYPGVEPLLDEIEADGRFATGLVTGNMVGGAWRKLDACGLAHRFGFGAFGSDSEVARSISGMPFWWATRLTTSGAPTQTVRGCWQCLRAATRSRICNGTIPMRWSKI